MRRAALLALALAAGCGARILPVATDADAVRVGATVADLNHGRTLLLGHCSSCHQPPSPGERLAADWPPHVREMSERAGLTPLDAALVERYLTAFARDQIAATAAPR